MNNQLKTFPVSEKFHQEGLNVRYLGVVLGFLPPGEDERVIFFSFLGRGINVIIYLFIYSLISPSQSVVCRTWLLMVIVTRVIKNEIKALLRGTMAKVFLFFSRSFSSPFFLPNPFILGENPPPSSLSSCGCSLSQLVCFHSPSYYYLDPLIYAIIPLSLKKNRLTKRGNVFADIYWKVTLKKLMKKWFFVPSPYTDDAFPLKDILLSEEATQVRGKKRREGEGERLYSNAFFFQNMG